MHERVVIPDSVRLIVLIFLDAYHTKAYHPLSILFTFALWKIAATIVDWVLEAAIENRDTRENIFAETEEDDHAADSGSSSSNIDISTFEEDPSPIRDIANLTETLGRITPDPA